MSWAIRHAFRRTAGRLAFWRDERGAALIETIIIVPVIVVFSVGILEFGVLLFTKLQVETGLRDASRYWARCQPGFGCSLQAARNLAVYGKTAPDVSADKPRAIGWTPGDVIITPAVQPALGAAPTAVNASTNFNYSGTPLLGTIGLSAINVQAFHQDRYIGW